MDPYLEKYWRDVHARFIIYSGDQLNGSLPRDLRCRVEERIVVEPDEEGRRSIYPDARIFEQPSRGGGANVATVAVLEQPMLGEPLIIPSTQEEITETYLEIIDVSSGNKVVTVIEVLSLANKRPGPGQDQYLKKQEELLKSDVSLVEIDLLRGGQRVQAARETSLPRKARTPYRVCVRRARKPNQFEFYPLPLRDPLVGIRIPLRESDADAALLLQELIGQCYRHGRYDDIDYRVPPEPPLSDDDAEWARTLIAGTEAPTPVK